MATAECVPPHPTFPACGTGGKRSMHPHPSETPPKRRSCTIKTIERRSEWDEERKTKLARLYERFKPEMWAKVAEEMGVPWRAAEAMHWQLGEADMARRAGVVPFSLSSTPIDPPWSGTRSTASASPSDGYTYGGIGIGRGQGMGMPITGGPPMLPSVAEMTTGMSPYNTSAYLVSAFMSSAQPRSSPIPTLPAIGYALYPNLPAMSEGKSR